MKHNFIWNITRACPWTCSFCCVGALYVPEGEESHQKRLEAEGLELSLDDKMRIVDNLDSNWFKIDVSGGEPLLFADNRHVVERLALKLGKDRVSVTSTGKGLELVSSEWLMNNVSEVGFTYDFPREPSPNRPVGYNQSNLDAVKALDDRIVTMAQTPLTRDNTSPEVIAEIYQNLREANVDSLLLMGFVESGRGHGKDSLGLTRAENMMAVAEYRKQEEMYGGPKVRLIPSLYGSIAEKCISSFNIDVDGNLLSNPWSYAPNGKPESHVIMGDLKSERLSSIAGRSLPQAYLKQLGRNLKK